MTPALEIKLAKKYPQLLPIYEKGATCLRWGIECEDGWHPLLTDLLEKLEAIRTETGATAKFDQIKSKFGRLHAYYTLHYKGKKVANTYISLINLQQTITVEPKKPKGKLALWNQIIRDIISSTELLSARTCEFTGETGTLCHPASGNAGWLYTLSKEEAKKRKYTPCNPQIAQAWGFKVLPTLHPALTYGKIRPTKKGWYWCRDKDGEELLWFAPLKGMGIQPRGSRHTAQGWIKNGEIAGPVPRPNLSKK